MTDTRTSPSKSEIERDQPVYELVDPEKLQLARRNARTHSKQQLAALADSMKAFGTISPIIVDAEYRIVAGHGRWEAARKLGLSKVPILRVEHLTDEQLRLYAIADNRIAERSGWDEAILAIEFKELELALPDLSLSVSGFELPKIDLLTASLDQTDWSDLDQVPACDPNVSPVTVSGDIWVFGDAHRLACGNSADSELLAKLMMNRRAQLIVTDPPYNLRASEYSGRGRNQHQDFGMAAGEMSSDEFTAFLSQALASSLPYLEPGALIYSFMDWKHLRELIAAGDANTLELKNICVWDKGKGGMGSLYRSAHEMICVFKFGQAKHKNRVELGQHGRSRSNIWRYEGFNRFGKGRDRALAMHATVKPVEMICDMILDTSDRGDVVFDGFGGSGTTLIAAEKLGRHARLVELDPQYCDTIVRRFADAFGAEPVHADLDVSYSEVAALRHSSQEEHSDGE